MQWTKRITVSFPDGASKEEIEKVLSELWGSEVKMPEEHYQQFISNEKNQIKKIIEPFYSELKAFEEKNIKKVYELIDLGKFIHTIASTTGQKIEIVSCEECPDFVVKQSGEFIGVEHTRLIDTDIVIEISKLEQALKTAKNLVTEKSGNVSGLFNVFVSSSKPLMHHPRFDQLSNKEKAAFKEFGKSIPAQVAHYIFALSDNVATEKPEFIDKVVKVNAADFDIKLREEYFLKGLSKETLLDSIRNKESKLDSYFRPEIKKYWLLIVSDGVLSKSSFDISVDNLPRDYHSRFDQIIIFDNYSKRIWYGSSK